MARAPFPLQWPDGWERTAPADRRHFYLGRSLTTYQATDRLLYEIRLGFPPAAHEPNLRVFPVITSNLPTTPEGRPRPGTNAADPGVAVYWEWRGREYVIACDRWCSASDNLRALAAIAKLLRELGPIAPADLVSRLRGLLVSPSSIEDLREVAGG